MSELNPSPMLTDDSDSDGTIGPEDQYRYMQWSTRYRVPPLERKLFFNQEIEDKYGPDAAAVLRPKNSDSGYRYFRLFRIFQAVIGFHTGRLDLSGRHMKRYETVFRSWKALEQDFTRVISEAAQFCPLEDLVWKDLPELSILSPRLHDLPFAVALRSRWRLQGMDKNRFDMAVFQFFIAHKILLLNPSPRFQTLSLHDLPDEILEEVMTYPLGRHPEDRSSSLSMTCRRLHAIGRRHVFHTYKVVVSPYKFIDHKYLWRSLEGDTASTDDQEYIKIHVQEAAARCQDHCLNALRFLRDSDTQLTQSIKSLIIEDSWNRRNWPNGIHTIYVPLNDEFRKMFRYLLAMVLEKTENLHTLVYNGILLDSSIVQSLSKLQALQTVKFRHSFSELDPSQLAMQTVQTVRMYDDCFVYWNVLALFPQMHTLMISAEVGIYPSHRHLDSLSSFNPFISLERVIFENLNMDNLPMIISWLEEAPQLRLIDFRVILLKKTEGHTLIRLVHALQAAPLKTLMIDGASNREMELLECIEDLFPDLVELFLGLRLHDRQRRHTVHEWPLPSATYAATLTRFRKLRHFMWNYRIHEGLELSSILLAFESNFEALALNTEDDSEEEMDYSARRYHDVDFSRSIALPFAAYCPTLETFSVCASEPDKTLSCCITRQREGSAIISPDFSRRLFFDTIARFEDLRD